MRQGAPEQRIAVWGRARDRFGRHYSHAARPIVYNDLLSEILAHVLRDKATHSVAVTARSERHDDLDRTLRPRRGADRRCPARGAHGCEDCEKPSSRRHAVRSPMAACVRALRIHVSCQSGPRQPTITLTCESVARHAIIGAQIEGHRVTDTLGFRKRIGLVVPSTNTTVQPECDALRPRGVTNHTARSTIKERPLNTEQAFFEHMQDMREGIGTAIDQIMTAGLDHLIMGIALETFWGGVAAADKFQSEIVHRAGVGISMGSTASVTALKAFGAKRIAVLTPHQPRGDEMVRPLSGRGGI